jgi:hypothetical protein
VEPSRVHQQYKQEEESAANKYRDRQYKAKGDDEDRIFLAGLQPVVKVCPERNTKDVLRYEQRRRHAGI